MKNDPAFAIVRIDSDLQSDEDRFTVTRVVWDQAFAESEVARLNELNRDKGAHYFWQSTRAQPIVGQERNPKVTFLVTCLGVPECTVAFEPEGATHALRENDVYRVEIEPGDEKPYIEIGYSDDGLSIVEGSDATVRAWNRAGANSRFEGGRSPSLRPYGSSSSRRTVRCSSTA